MGAIVRYADDAVIICRTRKDAEIAFEHLKRIMAKLKLTLNPQKTKIVDTNKDGFDFLGFRYQKFDKTKSGWKLPYMMPSKKVMKTGILQAKKYREHVLYGFRKWYVTSGIEYFYYLNKKRYGAVF